MVNDLREGYQHVYFPDGDIFSETPPPSVFITVTQVSGGRKGEEGGRGEKKEAASKNIIIQGFSYYTEI